MRLRVALWYSVSWASAEVFLSAWSVAAESSRSKNVPLKVREKNDPAPTQRSCTRESTRIMHHLFISCRRRAPPVAQWTCPSLVLRTARAGMGRQLRRCCQAALLTQSRPQQSRATSTNQGNPNYPTMPEKVTDSTLARCCSDTSCQKLWGRTETPPVLNGGEGESVRMIAKSTNQLEKL